MELKNRLESVNFSIYSDDSTIETDDSNLDFSSNTVRALEKDEIEIINQNKSRESREEVAK